MLLVVMIVILAVALPVASYTRPGFVRSMIFIGMFLAVGSWLPLLAGIVLDPDGKVIGNALGLGILAWFGSGLGFFVIIVGLLIRLKQVLT